MTSRHYRDRLILDTASANKASIDQAIDAWAKSSQLLETVADRVRGKGIKIESEIEGQAGTAMVAKFIAISDKLTLDAENMKKGSQALVVAADAADEAIKTRKGLALSDSSSQSPTKPEGPSSGTQPTPQQTQALATYNSDMVAYEANEAAAEEQARLALQHLDKKYAEATVQMKEIHGEPDQQDQAPNAPSQGPGAPAPGNTPTVPGNVPGGGGGTTNHGVLVGGVFHLEPEREPQPEREPEPDREPEPEPEREPNLAPIPTRDPIGVVGGSTTNVLGQADSGSTFQSSPTGSTPSAVGGTSAVGVGVAGGAAVGMAGAGLGAGMMKGGLPGSSSTLKAGSVRGIGAGGRASAPGALGRSTSAPTAGRAGAAGSSARSATGGRAAAAGSTSRTAGAGGRAGVAGSTAKGGTTQGASKSTGSSTGKSTGKSKGLFGRGTNGSVTGGRSGKKATDETTTSADSLVYEQDWLGDDSVAPSVLD